MRRKWRWDPAVGELVEVDINSTQPSRESAMVMPDIEDFVSPVDGSIVNGRRGLREHNKRNDVTNAADFKNQWADQRKERERFYSGDSSYDRKERVTALKEAFEKHRRT